MTIIRNTNMKATNNKKAKRYIKPEISCCTIEPTYLAMSSSEYYEKDIPHSEEFYDGELE